MSLFRDAITGLFRSIRGFSGAMQVVWLTDGFWRKRSYRAYREFTIPAGQAQWLRLTAPTPFMLQHQTLYVESGSVRAVIYTAPVLTNTVWESVSTIFGRQLLGGTSLHQSTIDRLTSGTITGGSEREALRASAGGGPGNTRNPTGTALGGWRLLPAGTYYVMLTAASGDGEGRGIYSIEAEELPV